MEGDVQQGRIGWKNVGKVTDLRGGGRCSRSCLFVSLHILAASLMEMVCQSFARRVCNVLSSVGVCSRLKNFGRKGFAGGLEPRGWIQVSQVWSLHGC